MRLDDMADDAIGLMDALGVGRAHVVGASMGGMIAQLMAINHPARTKSLTSIMSTTGRRDLPPGAPNALAVLAKGPKTFSRHEGPTPGNARLSRARCAAEQWAIAFRTRSCRFVSNISAISSLGLLCHKHLR
jgi:pimeloyl-ACP methyl ester carboxylesterase